MQAERTHADEVNSWLAELYPDKFQHLAKEDLSEKQPVEEVRPARAPVSTSSLIENALAKGLKRKWTSRHNNHKKQDSLETADEDSRLNAVKVSNNNAKPSSLTGNTMKMLSRSVRRRLKKRRQNEASALQE